MWTCKDCIHYNQLSTEWWECTCLLPQPAKDMAPMKEIDLWRAQECPRFERE